MFQDMESWKEAIMEFEEAIKMRRLAPDDAFEFDYYYGLAIRN